MKALLGIIFCVLIGNKTYAQKNEISSTYMRTDRSGLYKVDVGASKEDAEFIRVISPPDTIINKDLYQVFDFYLTGKPKLSGLSLSSDYAVISLEGPCIEFYPNGKRKSIINFHEGIKVGYANSYYPNGKMYLSEKYEGNKTELIDCLDSTGKVLTEEGNGNWVKYTEDFKNIERQGTVKDGLEQGEWKGKLNDSISYVFNYVDGVCKSGNSVDVHGNTYPYSNEIVFAQFKGGDKAFKEFVRKNLNYPEFAVSNGAQGNVVVLFIVDTDGSVTNIRVGQPVDTYLDREAIRIMKKSPRWIPGFQKGIPFKANCKVFIKFSLIDNNYKRQPQIDDFGNKPLGPDRRY